MLNKTMFISKEVNRKFNKEYFFLKGKINIESDYFIEKIKNSCSSDKNLNFKTNVKGLMTPWQFFSNDKKFLDVVKLFVNYIDDNYNNSNYHLDSAWGFEIRPHEKTIYHAHNEAKWCGVIYLNNCEQPLNFPEIKEHIKPETGAFALFSPFLIHGCERNSDNNSKFCISFNMYDTKSW